MPIIKNSVVYSLLTAMLWATTGIFIKYLSNFELLDILTFRFVVALIASVMAFRIVRYDFHLLPVALLMTAYYIFASYGFYTSPVALVALIIATSPVFTLIFRWFNREQIAAYEIYGFFIAFVGLASYFYAAPVSTQYTQLQLWLGAGAALLAAISRALFSVCIWRSLIPSSRHMAQLNILILLLGTVIFLPTMFVTPPIKITVESFSAIIGLGVIATFLPNLFNAIASKHVNPTLHNTLCMMTPLFAAVLAWVLLGESQSAFSLLCILVVVMGVLVTSGALTSKRTT